MKVDDAADSSRLSEAAQNRVQGAADASESLSLAETLEAVRTAHSPSGTPSASLSASVNEKDDGASWLWRTVAAANCPWWFADGASYASRLNHIVQQSGAQSMKALRPAVGCD